MTQPRTKGLSPGDDFYSNYCTENLLVLNNRFDPLRHLIFTHFLSQTVIISMVLWYF